MTAIAKVTSKGQTRVPQEIRTALNVGPGDYLAWDVGTDGIVRVWRVLPPDLESFRALESTLHEWSSAADEAAYRGL